MKLLWRCTASVGAILAYGCTNYLLQPVSNLMAGRMAGQQLSSSDTAYLASTYGTDIATHLGLPFLALVAALGVIWWKPLRKLLLLGLLLGSFVPHPSFAYYQKSDYAEPIMIEPSESAFWVPSVGDNEASQTQTDTEDYYEKKKVFRKLFLVPHMHLAGSGAFFDYYVPAGTLIIVDRSMYSREWVSATERGTSKRDDGFHCQSSEGLDTTVGISIGTEVTEAQAARYLSHFKVKNVDGSRTDPQVMFNAVFYSPSLAEVMDHVLRPVIGQMVCKQLMARTVDQAAAQANDMMTAIRQDVSKYLEGVGVKLDNIGWVDTFTYDTTVQSAINQKYAATKEREILDVIQQKTLVETVAKWNGILPGSISTTFWPESWTKTILGLMHIGTKAPTPPTQ